MHSEAQARSKRAQLPVHGAERDGVRVVVRVGGGGPRQSAGGTLQVPRSRLDGAAPLPLEVESNTAGWQAAMPSMGAAPKSPIPRWKGPPAGRQLSGPSMCRILVLMLSKAAPDDCHAHKATVSY